MFRCKNNKNYLLILTLPEPIWDFVTFASIASLNFQLFICQLTFIEPVLTSLQIIRLIGHEAVTQPLVESLFWFSLVLYHAHGPLAKEIKIV